MQHPRVECPVCGGTYAAVPVRAVGMVSIHDHKIGRRALVLCPGSMVHVAAPFGDGHGPYGAWQEVLFSDGRDDEPDAQGGQADAVTDPGRQALVLW